VTEPAIDLNADLGEGAPHDEGLLDLVSSASVACGFHAGSPAVMVRTARAARARRVSIGAHPSYPDAEGFGRSDMDLPVEELVGSIGYQIGAMRAAAAVAGSELGFVKPHGALYNRAAVDGQVADAVVSAVSAVGSGKLALLGLAGSELVRRARAAGLQTYSEGFADRAYTADGSLVPRSAPGSVLHDPQSVARQALDLVIRGRVTAISGETVEVQIDSLCLHGDSPAALDLARALRLSLEEAGVAIRPFIGLSAF
jgi:UPF0271 protein